MVAVSMLGGNRQISPERGKNSVMKLGGPASRASDALLNNCGNLVQVRYFTLLDSSPSPGGTGQTRDNNARVEAE